MRNIIATLLAAFLAAGSVSAQEVDLQIRNAQVVTFYGDDNYKVDFLYVTIQNNGPDDFQGELDVSVSDGNTAGLVTFSGMIPSRGVAEVSVLGSPKDVAYSLYLDPGNKVQETNKNNNYLYYKASEPQIRLTSHGLIAKDLYDTLYVTPGELYAEQFVVQDMNKHKSMVGVDFTMSTNLVDLCNFSTFFEYISNIKEGYECSVTETKGWSNQMRVTLLANKSEYADSYYWAGIYEGCADNQIGKTGYISIGSKFAQTNLQNGYDYAVRFITVRDAIRCDLTGDGVVDNEDLFLLKEVVNNNLHNPWTNTRNLYTKKGINYGAGRILFSRPDFLSVALLNIWLNNPNDPLVQGLGIGELMSENLPGSEASAIKSIENTFSVSENGKVAINAPDADVYNVTAQDVNGKMIQRTGRLGEEISLPIDAKNIRVETVKIKNGTTGLFSPKSTGPQISAFPNPVTDYVNISSPEDGKLIILNLNGQEIYSSAINAQESLTLSTGDWLKGVYLIKIATDNGQSTVKVVK